LASLLICLSCLFFENTIIIFLMRSILIISLVLAALSLSAQTPYLISYQGVACDADGNELINKGISIRLSILKDSPQGQLQYIESHPSGGLVTDAFGLFSLQIGSGVIQPGGLVNNMRDINWASGAYWLKVDMDVSGGSNFTQIGLSRLVSVPYAFYADQAKSAQYADSSRVSAFANRAQQAAYADSSKVSNYAHNAGASLTAVNANTALTAINATNAVNAQNAVTAQNATSAQTALNATNAVNAQNAVTAQTSLFADSTRVANYAHTAGAAQTAINATNAVNATNAINAQNAVNATNAQNATTAQTATNAVSAQTAIVAQSALNDFDRDSTNELQGLFFDGTTLSLVPLNQATNPVNPFIVNFNQDFQGPGASQDFPDGLKGKYIIIPDAYVVPAGKSLYVTSGGQSLFLPLQGVAHPTSPTMPIFPEFTVIQNCKCTALEVTNATNNVTPVLINMNVAPFTYTVPSGKVLVVKSGIDITQGRIEVKSTAMPDFLLFDICTSPYEAATRMPTFPEGTVIRKPSFISSLVFTGYLFDKFQ
jgi:hypothetical protein